MQIFIDYQGREITLTDETIDHITLAHPEIIRLGIEDIVTRTLQSPEVVTPSRPRMFVYHRMYMDTEYGDKYGRVVVKILDAKRLPLQCSLQMEYVERQAYEQEILCELHT